MAELKWWQTAVFYQIYPRSFADDNGDGIGDLKGMCARLDYLKDLGVGAVWLSPHYPSAMIDCGYDISDYVNVAPEYGSLEEFRQFLSDAHQREIRVVLDLVLNHTSDQHAWFQESRSGRQAAKRDWYIWREGKNGGPPNNWYSTFGGSAWELDAATGMYYYHFFFKEQPDLNWRNPEVKQAMWDAARFWLDMGVDGFRLDAIGTIFENDDLPDQQAGITLDEYYRLSRLAVTDEDKAAVELTWKEMFHYQHDLPGMHELMRELRSVVDEYPDRVLIGETDDLEYYGSGTDELHLVFNFPLMRTDRLTPAWIQANQALRLSQLPADAWPCNTLGNHDSPRMYSHFGDGLHNDSLARLNLAMLMTIKGTPVLYNGEEIGMSDSLIMDVSRFRDPLGARAYRLEMELMGSSPNEAVLYAALNGRDKGRTPFQWSNTANGGFCPRAVEPWLPVNPNYVDGINLEEQRSNSDSLYNYYRTIMKIRCRHPALVQGDYRLLHDGSSEYLAFVRETDGETCLVVLNYSEKALSLAFDLAERQAMIVYSNYLRRSGRDHLSALEIAPFEIYIGRLLA